MSQKTKADIPESAQPANFYINGLPGRISAGLSDFEKGQAFDSTYASVKAISNAFVEIRPYAIDQNGKPLDKTRLTDVLARPNNRMSGAEFREALATTLLTHRRVALLVYHQERGEAVLGMGVTEANLAGFNFLEDFFVKVIDGKKFYVTYNSKGERTEYSEDYVVELSAGVDPYSVYEGYSPTQAIKKWANIEDFIASFEAGEFENNAIPSGQFVITAPTVSAFNDIVDTLQRKHRGAGKNNNVDYVHEPLSATGEPLGAQIKWIPYSRSNNELDLHNIFEQVNNKLDSVFGVPSSIRGVNKNNTYASVKVDEQVFVKYTVKPFATKVWLKLTSELNRITGGLGYALTFDLEIPNIAEEEKTEAERKQIELNIITEARNAGYSLNSIIDAFGLSTSYKLLKEGSGDAEIVNDKPEVQDDGENNIAPSPLPKAHSRCTCEACKSKIVAQSDLERKLRKVLGDAMAEMILRSEEKLSAVGLEQYDKDGDGVLEPEEIDNLIADIDAMPEEQDYTALVAGIASVAFATMHKTGNTEFNAQLKLLSDAIKNNETSIKLPQGLRDILDGKDTEEAKALAFNLTGIAQTDYKNHLQNIVSEYLNGTRNSINEMARAVAEVGGTKEDIKNAIGSVKKQEEWKAERIARTEEHRAQQDARIQAVKQLSDETGATYVKVWVRDPFSNSCEFCIAMNGTEKKLDQPFISVGEVIQGADGGMMSNTYEDAEWAQAHPNCRCKLIFRRVD